MEPLCVSQTVSHTVWLQSRCFPWKTESDSANPNDLQSKFCTNHQASGPSSLVRRRRRDHSPRGILSEDDFNGMWPFLSFLISSTQIFQPNRLNLLCTNLNTFNEKLSDYFCSRCTCKNLLLQFGYKKNGEIKFGVKFETSSFVLFRWAFSSKLFNGFCFW